MLEVHIRQLLLKALPLTSFFCAWLPGADYLVDLVLLYQFGKHVFWLPKRDVEALAKGPEIAFQGHQALPQETPAVFAHGTEPERPGLEPAGLYHVHAQQHV